MAAVANALPATTIAGSVLTTAETTPALQNVIASNKPAWGTLSAPTVQTQSTSNGGLNTGSGNITSGSLNTGSISSGSINTNEQPIYGPGRQLLNYPAPGGGNWSGSCNGWSCSWTNSPSTEAVWAQPCISMSSCGSWGWWGIGSWVSCICTVWWNVTYGQEAPWTGAAELF